MNATAILLTTREELQGEYAIALRSWSDTKSFYGPDSPEVEAATELVEELEHKLQQYPL
ncbi:MAG: hypothetical protein ABIR70_02275 [Bryobacteraceae bacterium]